MYVISAGRKDQMRHLIRFATILFTLFAVGCAATTPEIVKPTPLAANDLAWLREQPKIVVIHHKTPTYFQIQMSDAGANFLEGFGAQTVLFAPYFSRKADERLQTKASREGNRVRREYSIVDPVLTVKERFLEALRTKLELTNLQPISEPAIRYEPHQLADSFGAGVALDFITAFWVLSREPSLNPFAADRHYLRYAVESRLLRLGTSQYHGEPQSPEVARLLRSDDSKILWQDACYSMGADLTYTMKSLQQFPPGVPIRGGQPYTLEEWTANNGTLLRGKLNEVADACAKALLVEFAEFR
jgi:hypothetical protein